MRHTYLVREDDPENVRPVRMPLRGSNCLTSYPTYRPTDRHHYRSHHIYTIWICDKEVDM